MRHIDPHPLETSEPSRAASSHQPSENPEPSEAEWTLQSLQEEVQRLKSEQIRQLADQDNFRKRLQKNFDEQKKFANEQYFRDLLPILDSLEASLTPQTEASTASLEGVLQGVKATLKLLQGFLKLQGVVALDPLNQPFDPREQHVMRVEAADSGVAPNQVVAVLQKGYRLHQRLLRPAWVAISSETSGQAQC